MLAIVVCALAFTVAVPLRTYLEQQAELSVQRERHAELEAKADRLAGRKAELSDPAVIEAEARRRLGLVMPGETPYMVQLPGEQRRAQQQDGDAAQRRPDSWYAHLWAIVNGAGGKASEQTTEGNTE